MYSEELSAKYMEKIEELSGNLEELAGLLEEDSFRHDNVADRALEATTSILDYITREYDLDQKSSLLSRHKVREALGGDDSRKVERYPESALNHMEIVLYSFRDLLEGETGLRDYPPNIHDSPVERHGKLAELSGEILSDAQSLS